MERLLRIQPTDTSEVIPHTTRLVDLTRYSCPDFEAQVGRRPEILPQVQVLIEERTAGIADPGERAARRYEVEYASPQELSTMLGGVEVPFDGCNYTYWTPLMDPEAFTRLTDIPREGLAEKTIIEAGAGSGDLIKTLIGWGADPRKITGIDISPTSAERVSELGANGVCGRLDRVVGREQADMVFLSYFVDRDADQRATFTAAIAALKPGGTLVLEGLFPSDPVDPNGLVYAEPGSTITRGKDAAEDMHLVCAAFQDIAVFDLGMRVRITAFGCGFREVYSRDDRELLTSDVIVAQRTY